MRHPWIINNGNIYDHQLEKRDRNYESEANILQSADLESNGCRNAAIAPEYHDYCALVVDRYDVNAVVVGLMAGEVGEH